MPFVFVRNTHGFTLVEIMIVVSVIGLLASLAIPQFVLARDDAREGVCINNLRQLDSAKEQYTWANNLDNGDSLPGGGSDLNPYLKVTFANMICPAGSAAYTVNAISTDPDCPNVGTYAGHVI